MGLEGKKILVVDDSIAIRQIIRNFLYMAGCRDISECSDCSSAMMETRNNHYDLVVIDYTIEPITGIQYIRWIRHDDETPNVRLPILLITANTDADVVQAAARAGVDGIIAKPFSGDTFMKKVNDILFNRPEFVITDQYVGPERRTKGRANG